MVDNGHTIPEEALSRSRPVPDGSADHLAEKVSIEVDRLSGTVKDGVEAIQTASGRYGDLFMETYAKMIRGSMQSSVDAGDHLLALLRAKTPADAFTLNVEFMQKSLLSTQERLLTIMGLKRSAVDRNDRAEGRA